MDYSSKQIKRKDRSIIDSIWVYKIERLGFVDLGVYITFSVIIFTFDFIMIYKSKGLRQTHDLYYDYHKGNTKTISCPDLQTVLKFLENHDWN